MGVQLIGYYRVSTQRQGQSGLGLEAQKEQVRRYATSVAGDLLSEHVEVESGKVTTRPILAEAMAECRRRKAVLCIAKLDRLARNVSFVSTLLDSKLEFVACDAPHATRMMLQILSVFAEHEARMISERTKAALAAARARGVVLGSHGRMLAEQYKAEAVVFAATMSEPIAAARCAGASTFAQIADHLDRAGYLTREGSRWLPMSVARVVRRLDQHMPAHVAGVAA